MNINRIREAIEVSKISKSELSKLTKVSRTTIENLLAGADVKVSTIENLAYVLKLPVGYFFDDNIVNITASGAQSVATNSGDVTYNGQTDNNGHIGVQNNYGCSDSKDKKDNVTTLTDTVATLTKELETSQQQKSHLIDVVSTSQQQILQMTNIIDRLTTK